VGAGKGITESFRATGKFPEMVLQLMATGEEAGDLDSLLIKSSDFYDREVEAQVHSLSSLIEPLMIVIVGALIGVIVVSMFLPIFYLGDAIMQGGANF
jgi:type IV pilus assembly protein PilC